MWKVREEIIQRKERFHRLSKKVDNNRMTAAELEELLRGLQAGEERRGSNASQVNQCFLDTVAEQLFTMGAAQAKHRLKGLYDKFLKRFEANTLCANARKRRKKRAKESQPTDGSPAPGGCNEGLPASPVFDPARFRGENVESGGAGNFKAPYDRKRSLRVESSDRWKKMEFCQGPMK